MGSSSLALWWRQSFKDWEGVSQNLGEYLTTEEIKEEGMEEILYTKVEKPKKQSKKVKKKYAKNVNKKHKLKTKSKTIKQNTVIM